MRGLTMVGEAIDIVDCEYLGRAGYKAIFYKATKKAAEDFKPSKFVIKFRHKKVNGRLVRAVTKQEFARFEYCKANV